MCTLSHQTTLWGTNAKTLQGLKWNLKVYLIALMYKRSKNERPHFLKQAALMALEIFDLFQSLPIQIDLTLNPMNGGTIFLLQSRVSRERSFLHEYDPLLW